jgi:hypothetical protein
MKRLLSVFFLFTLFFLFGCKKDVAYQLNEEDIFPIDAQKGKLKTEGQYLAILHANLFQQALSANKVIELEDIIFGFGDKDLIHEVIISNLMNKQNVQLPTDSAMHADPEQFMLDTYERFLIRRPSEAELTWFINYIDNHPNVSTELVYFAFALSNEYLYY